MCVDGCCTASACMSVGVTVKTAHLYSAVTGGSVRVTIVHARAVLAHHIVTAAACETAILVVARVATRMRCQWAVHVSWHARVRYATDTSIRSATASSRCQ